MTYEKAISMNSMSMGDQSQIEQLFKNSRGRHNAIGMKWLF
jgi:hypothetical protein